MFKYLVTEFGQKEALNGSKDYSEFLRSLMGCLSEVNRTEMLSALEE